MATYYYSTQPFLAWCLNHYFYAQEHRVWLGAPFYPYKLANPRSSSPLRIYEDFYEPWKDQDEFSSIFAQKRLNLWNTVNANAWRLAPGFETRLKATCDQINLVFFYPIVYRINIDTIDSSRLKIDGSGLVESQEYVIEALLETEFDILFIDLELENVPNSFTALRAGRLSQTDVLNIFESWYF